MASDFPDPTHEPTFDRFADEYEDVLNKSLSISGETTAEFSKRRILWIQRFLEEQNVTPERVLDYGCGTGNAIPEIREHLTLRHLWAVDVSTASLERARARYGNKNTTFSRPLEMESPQVDVVFSSCVFHHIQPSQRDHAVQTIFQSLRPGGWATIFEVTPWHPGVLYILKTCPFDREAITLRPGELKGLFSRAGFENFFIQFIFFFPKWLGVLRSSETFLGNLPFGAQYVLCARKPETLISREASTRT